MKKFLILLVVVVTIILACFSLTACRSFDVKKEVFGTWAIVYRFVDSEGNKVNYYTEGEYLTFNHKSLTYSVVKDGQTEIKYETSIKYNYGTSQDNQKLQGSTEHSLRSLNRYKSYCFSLGKFDNEKELGFDFYGDKCMVIGKYSLGIKFAVLIRVDNVGDEVEKPDYDKIKGEWTLRNDGSTYTLILPSLNYPEHTMTTSNYGYIEFISEWEDYNVPQDKALYSRRRTITFFATEDYIVHMIVTEKKDNKSSPIYTDLCYDSFRIYFRNNN